MLRLVHLCRHPDTICRVLPSTAHATALVIASTPGKYSIGRARSEVPSRLLHSDSLVVENSLQASLETADQARAIISEARASSFFALDDEVESIFTKCLLILRQTCHFKVAERWMVFSTATDTLLPLIHNGRLKDTQMLQLLRCYADADILETALLEAMQPALEVSMPKLCVTDAAFLCGLYAKTSKNRNSIVSTFVNEATKRLQGGEVPASVLAAYLFALCSLSQARFQARGLAVALVPHVSWYLASESFTTLATSQQLHQLQTVSSALVEQGVSCKSVAADILSRAAPIADAIESTFKKSKYVDKATRTKFGWMLSHVTYSCLLQDPTGLPHELFQHSFDVASSWVRLSAERKGPDAPYFIQAVTMLYRTALTLAPAIDFAHIAEFATWKSLYVRSSKLVTSESQKDVFKRLTRIAQEKGWPKPLLEHRLDCGLAVDILLPFSPAPIAIEVDGPFHFLDGEVAMQQLDAAKETTGNVRDFKGMPADGETFSDHIFGVRRAPTSMHADESLPAAITLYRANMSTLFHRFLVNKAGVKVISISHQEYKELVMGKSTQHGQRNLLGLLQRRSPDHFLHP